MKCHIRIDRRSIHQRWHDFNLQGVDKIRCIIHCQTIGTFLCISRIFTFCSASSSYGVFRGASELQAGLSQRPDEDHRSRVFAMRTGERATAVDRSLATSFVTSEHQLHGNPSFRSLLRSRLPRRGTASRLCIAWGAAGVISCYKTLVSCYKA